LTTGTISDYKTKIEFEKCQLQIGTKYMGPEKEKKSNYKRELCQLSVLDVLVQQNYYYRCNPGNQNDHYTYF